VKRTISTIIAGRQILFREGIAALLHNTHCKVVASLEAASQIDPRRAFASRLTLIILSVLGTPEETIRTAELARAQIQGEAKIVLVGDLPGLDVRQALADGVDGLIAEINSRDALVRVLDLVCLGQKIVVLGQQPKEGTPVSAQRAEPEASSVEDDTNRSESTKARLPFDAPGLSEREQHVLACVARGEPNKTIARKFAITESTVKVHLKAILRKLSARNRTEAAIWAIEHGLSSTPARHLESPPQAV
jgi:two-component system nitrate/nitrite response regulator NarL